MNVKDEKHNKENGKRVATLYRVSTKGQLYGDDIPMQKNACKDFIAKQENWTLVKEYIEKGVSGYKVSASKRDAIQKAKKDAENGLFDILLVFMFDRLGRREDETPFVVEWFIDKGVEIWSVKEGQQKIENHSDKLMNYIRYWKSSDESIQTSIRVSENHSQMVKKGEYRGGTVPFGYKTVGSGKLKKGKELLKVVIDEDQAKVVKKIYELVVEEGYGQNRIAKLLNMKGYTTKTGKPWSSAAVNNVLTNKLYTGYMVYAKGTEKEVTSEERLEHLVIIDDITWDKVQKIRKNRSPEKVKNSDGENIIKSTKSPLLFVGLIRCGHCGCTLTTTYNTKSYVRKDGTEIRKHEPKYRCSGKAQQKVNCDGQTQYSQRKIEGLVLEEVNNYLDQLKTIDFTSQINEFKKKNMTGEVKALRKLRNKFEEATSELVVLRSEVPKAIMGTSNFTSELLSSLIQEKEINELKLKVEEAEKELETKKIEVAEMEEVQKYIPVWREVFEKASIEKKKMMLNTIIDVVTVYRNKVEIDCKINVGYFLGAMGSESNNDALPAELSPQIYTYKEMLINYSV